MKRLLALLLLFAWPAFAQQAPLPCNNVATYSASSTGLTQIVAAVGTTRIYVCSYDIVVGGTATNVGLSTGTGVNCAGSTAALTPAWVLAINGQFHDASAFGNALYTPGGNALCVSASAANPVQVLVRYYQAQGQ